MNQVKSKLTALLCIFSLFCYTMPAYADNLENELGKNVVTNLKVGDTAPFEGILLSKTAAAKLYGQLNFFEQECKLTLSKELDIAKIRYDANIAALQLKLDVETTRTDRLLAIKNERIEFLESNWKPPAWYESGEFWMAVGLISGVLITVGTAHAISDVAR